MNTDQLVFQREVGAWHESIYGDDHELILPLVLQKFEEESGEFNSDPGIEEAADCYLVLMTWAHRKGCSLEVAARQKFQEVQGRDQRKRDEERGITVPQRVTP